MFQNFTLDADKSNNSRQFFVYKNAFKTPFVGKILIYTGIWVGAKNSIPVENLSLDQYTKLSVALTNNDPGCDDLLLLSKLDINPKLKSDLNRYLYKYTISYCDYELVPIDLIKQLFQELYPNLITEQKSGGICRKCGDFDDYAPVDSSDGKCFCYKCFK